jgi:biotin transport system substrate-specific component
MALLPSGAMSATPIADGLATPARTLGDVMGAALISERAPSWIRDAALVLAGTLLLTIGAWVSFTVPAVQLGQLYVPINEYVPLTLQTFGVLFTGAVLGSRRAIAATGLYLLIGIIGIPVFAADADGVHRAGLSTILGFESGALVLGATGGYLLGFVVAAAAVGGLAERGWDRRLGSSLAAMVIGSAIVYALGVTWLAVAVDLSIADALTFGLWPFLPGDIIKLLVAAGLLPLGWRLASGRASSRPGGSSGSA